MLIRVNWLVDSILLLERGLNSESGVLDIVIRLGRLLILDEFLIAIDRTSMYHDLLASCSFTQQPPGSQSHITPSTL